MTTLLTLFRRPGSFFADFSQTSPNWLAAYLGYCLITLASSLGAGNAAPASAGQGSAMFNLNGLLQIVLESGFSMVFYGVLWMYFGSRLVMGRASLAHTVQALGYAFLWPGLLGALAALLPVILPGALAGAAGPALTLLAIRIGAGVWAIVLAAIALQALNSLNWRRTLIAVLWLPVTLTAIAIGSIVLSGGTPPVQ
jgi:hypothetical protein